jgi:hypothetical protein
MLGDSRVAEQLVASQVGLTPMELDIVYLGKVILDWDGMLALLYGNWWEVSSCWTWAKWYWLNQSKHRVNLSAIQRVWLQNIHWCVSQRHWMGDCVNRLVVYPFTDWPFANGCYRYVRVSLSLIDGRIILCDVTETTVSVNKHWVGHPYLNPKQVGSVWVHVTTFFHTAHLSCTRLCMGSKL